jgi:hypothetical protein
MPAKKKAAKKKAASKKKPTKKKSANSGVKRAAPGAGSVTFNKNKVKDALYEVFAAGKYSGKGPRSPEKVVEEMRLDALYNVLYEAKVKREALNIELAVRSLIKMYHPETKPTNDRDDAAQRLMSLCRAEVQESRGFGNILGNL